MNKKTFLTLLLFAILMLASILSVSAATSDALIQENLNNVYAAKMGADYDPPFIAPEGNIDTTNGAVNITEQDLHLPGKSGLDINIYRKYNSYDPEHGYYVRYFTKKLLQPTHIAAKYTARINGVKKGTIYVAFTREEDIKDIVYMTKNQYEDLHSYEGLDYVEYIRHDENKEVELTLDKSAKTEVIKREITHCLGKGSAMWGLSLPHGWYLVTPHVFEEDVTTIDSNETYIRRKIYAEVYFEDGKHELLSYNYEYHRNPSNGITDIFYNLEFKNPTEDYDVEVVMDAISDERGFSYNLKITNAEGKCYYYLLKDPGKSVSGKITAISDRYGNCIRYNIPDVTSYSSYEIIDTYGRKITLSTEGITVEAGDMLKEIIYSSDVIEHPERKLANGYRTPHEYQFSVSEHTEMNHTGEEKSTVYTMNYKSAIGADNYYYTDRLYPVLKEIQYPTDARRVYTYEEKPNAPQYAYTPYGSYASPADYYLYRVAGEQLYESGELKENKVFTYEGVWIKMGDKIRGDDKTFVTTEMLENGHTRINYQFYSYFDRLEHEENQYKEGTRKLYTEKRVYFYGDDGTRADLTAAEKKRRRTASVKSIATYLNDEWISFQNFDYHNRRKPTLQQQGEKCTTYTYDDTYCLPLTVTTTQVNGLDLKQVNTLTADKKSVAKTQIYEGDTLKDTITYTYHGDGTLASETRTGSAGTIVTEYTYQYDSDGSYTLTTTVMGVTDANGVSRDITTATAIDPLGRKISETDGNGNKTQYSYDMLDQVIEQTNPDGTSQQVCYSVAQNRLTVTDENGNRTTRQFSPLGNLTSIYLDEDPSKVVAAYTYDNLGRLTSEAAYQDIGGMKISNEYTYDDLDRVETITSKENDTVLDVATNTYTLDNNAIATVSAGRDTTIDVSGYQKAEIVFYREYKNTGYQLYSEDGTFALESLTPYAITRTFDISEIETLHFGLNGDNSFSAQVFLLSNDSNTNLIGGAFQTVTTTYQGDEYYTNPTKVTTLNGYGDVVSEAFYDGEVTEENLLNKNLYHYDYNGNVIQSLGGRTYMENLGTYTTRTEYDYLGSPVRVTRADGKSIINTYDALGNLLTETDYMGNTTTHTYDKLGRVIRTVTPFDGNTTSETLTFYDNNGNVVMTKQQSNTPSQATAYTITEHEYDSRNRLICTKANDGERDIYTQYAYDALGNMVRMVTGQTQKLNNLYQNLPDGVTTATYEYDRFGNVTKATDSLGNSETAEYNLMGLPTKQTDRNGMTFNTSYNAYGSPLETQFTGGYTQYTYNTNNLLLDVTHKDDVLSANTYRYDAYGFVSKESTFLVEFDPNFIISTSIAEYTYDANGNRKTLKLTDDNSAVVTQATYTYDNLDRLTNVCADGITADYTYNDNGQLLTEATSDNTATYAYNRAGLVTALTNTNGADYTYAYQLDGNQIQKTDSVNGTATYTYDTLGQLKSETASGNTTSYTYDSRGNRISINNGGIISQYTYDTNNRLLTQIANVGGQTEYHTSYSYDNNGNLLLRNTAAYIDISSSDPSSLTLQVPESIAKKSVKDSMLVMYTYNSLNQLTKVESDDAVPISYLYDATGRRIRKTVGDEVTNHVWDGQNIVYESDGNNNPIAKYIRGNKLIAQVTDGKTSYYTYDAHGSVTGMDGVTYTYDAFGNLQNDMDMHNPFRYSGEYYDAETNMIYLRNRYYDPSVGRFITEDPVKDGVNWYAYCGNNPIMFVDPSGLIPSLEDAAEMASRTYYKYEDYNEGSDIATRKLGDGWRLIDVWTGTEGLVIHIYIRGDGENSSYIGAQEYAFVNKGSSTGSDWVNNVQQIIGFSTDMEESVEKARFFSEGEWGNCEITFVGHSKGGAEATANALATNRNAIIFNPAELSFGSLITNGIDIFSYSQNIIAYTVIGEPLSIFNAFADYGIQYITNLLPFYSWNPKKNHSIDAVQSGIAEWYN